MDDVYFGAQIGDGPNLEHQKVFFTFPKKAQLQQMVQNGDVKQRATPTDGPKRRCKTGRRPRGCCSTTVQPHILQKTSKNNIKNYACPLYQIIT